MKPFFSIIIPTLNEEKYLPKLLNDLFKQTEKDFEVIIADGYSIDKTKETVDGFKKKLNIKFYQTKLKNVAAQRNYGAIRSEGEYLIFVDADARIRPSFIKKLTIFINKHKGLVFIPYIIPEKGDEEYKPLFDISNLLVEFSQNLSRKFSLGGSMIFEKNFFQRIGGFDSKLYLSEDHELIQRIFKWGVTPKFMKDNKITFSLRRWKKEGNLKIIYKHFISTAYRLFGGEIKDKIFDYQMGGQIYNKEDVKVKKEEFFKGYLKQINELFNKLMKD